MHLELGFASCSARQPQIRIRVLGLERAAFHPPVRLPETTNGTVVSVAGHVEHVTSVLVHGTARSSVKRHLHLACHNRARVDFKNRWFRAEILHLDRLGCAIQAERREMERTAIKDAHPRARYVVGVAHLEGEPIV